ncbi:hypothetical protein JG688_00010190, partial [Phytophthora aleatoria]
ELCTLDSVEAAAEFVGGGFCCSQISHTDPYRQFLICHGVDHLMKWKIWRCNDFNRSRIYHNTVDHIRDEAVQCEGPHKSVITEEMKKFILQQDECGISP